MEARQLMALARDALREVETKPHRKSVVDVEEAAKALAVSPRTVRAMVRRGELIATRTGRQLSIPGSELKLAKTSRG